MKHCVVQASATIGGRVTNQVTEIALECNLSKWYNCWAVKCEDDLLFNYDAQTYSKQHKVSVQNLGSWQTKWLSQFIVTIGDRQTDFLQNNRSL